MPLYRLSPGFCLGHGLWTLTTSTLISKYVGGGGAMEYASAIPSTAFFTCLSLALHCLFSLACPWPSTALFACLALGLPLTPPCLQVRPSLAGDRRDRLPVHVRVDRRVPRARARHRVRPVPAQDRGQVRPVLAEGAAGDGALPLACVSAAPFSEGSALPCGACRTSRTRSTRTWRRRPTGSCGRSGRRPARTS